MNPATTRRALRWLHIVGSVVLGVYLYSPWGTEPVFEAVVLFGVFPALGASGVAMWQWPRLVRARRG
ncbi:MAG: hypothetical protein ABR510_10000 [Trueperaceae bacterium]